MKLITKHSHVQVGCEDCEEGWYGERCEVSCEPGDNYTCHPITGTGNLVTVVQLQPSFVIHG